MGKKRRFDQGGPGQYNSQSNSQNIDHKRQKQFDNLSSASSNYGRSYDLPKLTPYKPLEDSASSFPIPKNMVAPTINKTQLRSAVFRHPNARSGKEAGTRDDSMTYEPLEFLGDAYIEVIATRLIHVRFPYFNVGERSQCREMLVKNETLARFSCMYGWDLPGVLTMTGTAREDGGVVWTKILGDVFEAYVGAVVEDDKERGFATAERWLQQLWEPYLVTREKKAEVTPRLNVGELKDKLQNLLQNPKAGVKIEFRDAIPPKEDRKTGTNWYVREVLLTGWGHVNKSLGKGESAKGKTAEGLAISDAFTKNMDLIMEANAKKKAFEAKAREEKQANEADEFLKAMEKPPS